ncbi:hypothetical protein GF337_18235 [candidate division KSB1 bacterium]|nr:hypothetical protein [candidate division KSB1 bacterium]
MMKTIAENSKIITIVQFIRYNLKVIFSNKFIYFLLSAIAIFLLITVVNLLDTESAFDTGSVYNLLLVPGVLLIFYPPTFGIQNDLDTRMLETVFGIPNYRYKVHLVRITLAVFISAAILIVLAFLSSLSLTPIPVFSMTFQLMFPLAFICAFSFMFSTIVKNGNATAVIVACFGLFFFFGADPLEGSKWNLFHNPFSIPSNSSGYIWMEITLYNRIYLVVGAIIFVLFGLIMLQKRERFVS